MRASPLVLAMLVLSAACTDSCACGEGETASSGIEPAGNAPNAANAGAASVETPARPDAGPAAVSRLSWTPAPDSELTRKLQAAKAALETDEVYPELAKQESLAKLLADELAGFTAIAKAATTVRAGDEAELAVAARNYRNGPKTMRIKVTDTAKLPGARRAVSGRLTMIGNEAVGNERGVFIRGNNPAVIAHYQQQRVSRASAMVGNRYLFQVLINNTDQAEEALRVLEQIELAKLGRR